MIWRAWELFSSVVSKSVHTFMVSSLRGSRSIPSVRVTLSAIACFPSGRNQMKGSVWSFFAHDGNPAHE